MLYNFANRLTTFAAVAICDRGYYINNLTFFDDINQKPIVHFQALLKVLRRVNDQVQPEHNIQTTVDFQGLFDFPQRRVHDDQHIHIAFGARVPARIRAEQDDLLRLEVLHDLLHHLVNGFLWNALAFVNRRDAYGNHLEMIIQRLLTCSEIASSPLVSTLKGRRALRSLRSLLNQRGSSQRHQ